MRNYLAETAQDRRASPGDGAQGLGVARREASLARLSTAALLHSRAHGNTVAANTYIAEEKCALSVR
jgi:hypothetical protein